jgi:hypothetical protein
MPLYQIANGSFVEINQTSFAEEKLLERGHLQAMLRNNIGIIVPDAMVLAEEYGNWEDSRRRIDLLCLDRSGSLIVVELKRTDDGGHMDLQAIRYAAMVSKMTYAEAVKAHQSFKKSTEEEAEIAIKEFLGWDDPQAEEFANDVRIVLAGAEFSKEITTAVMWLRERDIDICCMKLEPHHLDGKVLVNVQKIIPLPEAEEYQVKIREKEKEARTIRTQNRDFTRYDLSVGSVIHPNLPKRRLVYMVMCEAVKKGFKPLDLLDATHAWIIVNGRHNKDSFVAEAESRRLDNSSASEVDRFFIEDDELFHCDGNTFALTKMWGGKYVQIIDELIEKCGLENVSYKKAGGQE